MAKESNPFLSHLMLVNTIGLSIIVESFRDAYYYLKFNTAFTEKVREKANKCEEAFLFIQGTGLDMIIYKYGCGYDASTLRNTFFSLANRRDLIE